MKRNRPARRRRPAPAQPSVSLFPFLAVLLCTMGALILLLVVIARQARLQAAQDAQAAARPSGLSEEELADLEAARELVEYRIERLRESRERAEAELEEARLGLGHIEDHARRLQGQIEQLEATLVQLEQMGPETEQNREALKASLVRVVAELADAERRLVEARSEAARRQTSYAVVPYQGPHETHRRPIFIECRSDSIVIQPEGIVFREEDFHGSTGPGNPLAAALRAVREYMLSRDSFDPTKQGEPYPLLLVRPGGIAAYYAARMALKSWASDFGYELIGQDWEIEYPSPDGELIRVAEEASQRARAIQKQLAAAAPRHYGGPGRPKVEYRATRTRGGVVPDGGGFSGGSHLLDVQRPRYQTSGGGTSAETATASETDRTGTAGTARRGTGHAESGPAGSHQPGASAEGSPGQSALTAAGERSTPPPPGSPSGQAYGRPYGEGATALGLGEYRPGAESSEGGGSAQGTNGAASGDGVAADNGAGESCSSNVQRLAEDRGRNWALPGGVQGSLPIARPVRIDCFGDRLTIVPERGMGQPQTIHLPGGTAAAVDTLVTSVWQLTDRWGIAGRGMYWRPVLTFSVAPGGEQCYEELRVLLDGSGLEVEREE